VKPKEPTLSRPPRAKPRSAKIEFPPPPPLLPRILAALDDDKAEEVVTIDLAGRSSLCDAIVIATGRSSRHVAALAENLARHLKEWGAGSPRMEGVGQGDWVLIDAGDIIVHIFREEVRAYYDLESMWSVDERKARLRPAESANA
jgi:ribosome-associated protein